MVFFSRATLQALKDGIAFRIIDRLGISNANSKVQSRLESRGEGGGEEDIADLEADVLALVAVAQLLHHFHQEEVNALHI